MKKNIIFLGKNGQIANAFFLLTEKLDNKNNDFDCQFYSSSDVDLSNPVTTDLFLDSLPKNIDLIVNCMAYTNVDKAEEEQDLCNKINNISVGVIAKYCFSNNIKFIHFSTDYVFDGTGSEPFSEDNTANLHPLNFYGKTKLLGEQAIQKSGCDYIIIRLSWVYDTRQTSKNFVNTIKRLAQEKEVLNIVCDQIGSPTSADFVAKNSMRIFEKIFEEDKSLKEIIHLNNGYFIS
ncbi:MAG: SDR family oxidoreductase, partial [Alphaproteobacteria bacterium]